MLEVKNLTNDLLENINLTVLSGQLVAIIGDNGSGKSTLAKTIASHYKYKGSVKPSASQISLLTQNPYLQFIGNTVFDELTYFAEQNNFCEAKVEQLLANCPFQLEADLATISGGSAQQLLIYKELYKQSQVVILDETLSNIDDDNKQLLLQQLQAQNKAIILITNNVVDTKYATAIYQLVDRKLLSIGNFDYCWHFTSSDKPVSFRYEQYEFKQGLNLVCGKSGSGKSRLLMEIAFNSEQALKCAYISQYPFEMVTTINAQQLIGSDQQQLLMILNLDESKLTANITSLSTGELVKVLLINALIQNKQYILIDEGLEVLDFKSQQAVFKLVEKHFKAAIIVSHNPYIFNQQIVNEVIVNEADNN